MSKPQDGKAEKSTQNVVLNFVCGTQSKKFSMGFPNGICLELVHASVSLRTPSTLINLRYRFIK